MTALLLKIFRGDVLNDVANRKQLIDEATEKWLRVVDIGWRLKKPTNNSFAYLHNAKISQRQYKILATISFTNVNTISELAKKMGLSKSTLSIIMSKLIKAGYVTKNHPDEKSDKRKVFFYATDSAAEIIRRQNDENVKQLRSFYNQISQEQQENFRKGIAILKETYQTNQSFTEATVIKYFHTEDSDSGFISLIDDLSFFMLSILERNAKEYSSFISNNSELSKEFSGITSHQFHLLFCIGIMGLNTIKKLEKFLGSSGSTLSITVSRLVEKGLVKKSYPASDEDGRMVYISITDKTKRLFDKAREIGEKCIRQDYIETLSNPQLEKFSTGLDYLIKVFESV